MPNLKSSGSALLAATLLATTTLTAPSQALADSRSLTRLAQADEPAPAAPELLPEREQPAAEESAPPAAELPPAPEPEPRARPGPSLAWPLV